MTALLPPDITALPVRVLDRLRSSLGTTKLHLRRVAIASGEGLSKSVLRNLRPINDAIDAINAEEARRDEAAFQKRVQARAARISV